MIEVPLVTDVFADDDEDAIYFTTGRFEVRDSLIGWARDDGIDSGSGGTGTVTVSNTWVESTYHEAFAWSGGGRVTTNLHTVSLNCGQGLECGWSTGANSPLDYAWDCLSLGNSIGLRHGDNYLSIADGYNGYLRVTNSLVLNNYRDIFGYNWRSGGGWTNAAGQMFIGDNWLTAADPAFPSNSVWDPPADGWRLASFMGTPPEAPVGVAFAVWTNQFDLPALFQGVPVGLSCFTTNFVSVDYVFTNASGPLGGGTLTFAPGETVQRIYPGGFDVFAHSTVQVVLKEPVQGELTGETVVTFQGTVPMPQVSCWTGTNTLPLGRLPEGMLVKLSTPAGRAVSVDYAYTAEGGTLANGTLTFAPGQTVLRIDPAGANPPAYDPIRLSLSAPTGGTLAGITTVIYGTPPVLVSFGVSSDQLDLATFTNGLPVALNGPTTSLVSVDFRCEGNAGLLTNGTLTFTAGQVAKTLQMPTVHPASGEIVRVSLAQPVNAELLWPSEVYYVPMVQGPSPNLVGAGSRWQYLDTGGDAGTAWRNLTYNDLTWSNGLAQLGFSNNEEKDEATLIRKVGTNGQNTVTFYFRQKFVVDDPGVFTSLALWLLRDDGGVVYLNGTEVFRSDSMPPSPLWSPPRPWPPTTTAGPRPRTTSSTPPL